MCEMIKTEEGDDLCSGDWDKQPFVLLLRVIQANGKPLPIGGFTTRAISQMLHDVAGAIPREVIIMNDQEVVMEFKGRSVFDGCFKAVHGLFHWEGQSINMYSLVAKRDLVTEIVRE